MFILEIRFQGGAALGCDLVWETAIDRCLNKQLLWQYHLGQRTESEVMKDLISHPRLETRISDSYYLSSNDTDHLAVKCDQWQLGEKNDRLLVVASADGAVLDLAKVGKAKEEARVKLEGRWTSTVELCMNFGRCQVTGWLGLVKSKSKVKLRVAHHP